MLNFKVLLVQKGRAFFIAYPHDVKRGVSVLGTSKKEALRGAQLAILDEVKERRELFIPDNKTDVESIIREKNIRIEEGDNVTLEQVGIEFSYNNVRLGEIH